MVLTFSGMMLMIVGLSNHTTMESGGIEQYMYPFWSFMAAIGGAILVTAGLSYLTYVRHPTETPVWPIDMAVERLERLLSNEPATFEPVKNGNMLPAPTEGEREPRAPEAAPIPERELVLRLLTGDERVLFKTLLDSGGEAYQKDLVLEDEDVGHQDLPDHRPPGGEGPGRQGAPGHVQPDTHHHPQPVTGAALCDRTPTGYSDILDGACPMETGPHPLRIIGILHRQRTFCKGFCTFCGRRTKWFFHH